MNSLNAQKDTSAYVNLKPVWQLAFRPFFLLAVCYAVVVMLLWLAVRHGGHFAGLNYYGVNLWHAHELVFGYGLAVIAGFLLTAIKNWTGVQTASGNQLKLLIQCWLLGRLVVFIPFTPFWLIAIFDVLFPLLLVYFVARPLLQVGNKRNYKMIVMVSLFAGLNLLTHVMLLSQQYILASQMTMTALMLILVLIAVMAGRVFPMFSQNGVAERYQAKIYPWLEKLWPPLMIAFVVVFCWFRLTVWGSWLLLLLSIVNAVIHAVRLRGWYNHQIWQKPLVWVLHVGYAFLVIGFVFVAASAVIPWLHFVALHVFTVGGVGLITMGMMARVSYGHSGRDLHKPPAVLWYCFCLLTLSALARITLPLIDVFSYSTVITLSGLLWIMAFGLFVMKFMPIWLKPRIDGKPG